MSSISVAPGLSGRPEASNLAYNFMYPLPINSDYSEINQYGPAIFQDQPALNPYFTNGRAPNYDQYVRREGYLPKTLNPDPSICPLRYNTQADGVHAFPASARPNEETR